ncbi:Uncharacterized protein SCG7109_CA_00010 [Chlamydiales bacterium SCGC AG-110-M15]|nr:Uncharacterized protein SCG7109_CA_00010 [Chlamydiales bacterium SCGC AG-110-M15]
MLNLIIDSSTERGLLAVLDGGVVLFEESLPFGLRSSGHLFPALEGLLRDLSLELKDFARIIVAKGPGSYTGIRVGASVAKAIAYSLSIPLLGVSTLYGFAPSGDGDFCVLIDAKVSGVYLVRGVRCGDEVTFRTEPGVCDLGDLREKLLGVKYVVTPNAKRLRPLVEAVDGLEDLALLWEECGPSGLLYAQGVAEGVEGDDEGLELMYLRKTQAEIELGRK